MKKQGLGMVMILAAASMWGTIGFLTRMINPLGFSSLSLIFYRALTTAVIMGIIILFKDKSLFRIKLRDIWIFIGSGVISFFAFNVCYMLSIGENSLAVAAILLYTSPVFVMLLSMLFFKEKISAKKTAALICALCGCALVSFGGEVKISFAGLLLGVGSGLGYALYSIFGTVALNRGYSTFTITFYTFLFASVAALSCADFSLTLPLFISDVMNVAIIALFSVWVTVLPYLLYTRGMEYNNATVASIVSTVEPVVAALFGFFAFGENPGASGAAGMALVILSIVILNIRLAKRKVV